MIIQHSDGLQAEALFQPVGSEWEDAALSARWQSDKQVVFWVAAGLDDFFVHFSDSVSNSFIASDELLLFSPPPGGPCGQLLYQTVM